MTPRRDRSSAACWAAFGVIVVIASWRLDRLENLHINPWSVPGLTPGLVGLLMILLAGALALQSPPVPDPREDHATAPPDPADAGNLFRTLLAGVMCVLFAGVSLGHGLPFLVEGAAFIFLFIAVFSWSQWRAEGRVSRGLLRALAISIAMSGLISWLFESVFLVRLP